MATIALERPPTVTAAAENQTHAGPQSRAIPAAHRTTARIVGAMYLAGFVVGIGGEVLIQSVLGSPNHLATAPANAMLLAIGAVLWLLAVAWDAAHGVLMFPVLRPHDERTAVGYLGFRIMDATFIAIMVLFALIQVPVGSEYAKAGAADASSLQALSTVLRQAQVYAYDIGMATLGIAGLMLCYTLYRAKLVPRPLAIWGLVGYAVIFCGMVSDLMGSGLGLISSLPGGLWEVFIGGWLIAKGFSVPAVPSGRSTLPTSRAIPTVPPPNTVAA
jgi:hypothetical protein